MQMSDNVSMPGKKGYGMNSYSFCLQPIKRYSDTTLKQLSPVNIWKRLWILIGQRSWVLTQQNASAYSTVKTMDVLKNLWFECTNPARYSQSNAESNQFEREVNI